MAHLVGGETGIRAVVMYQPVWVQLNISAASTRVAALKVSLSPRLLK